MATPEKHARCSASSSSRWLNCTAAPTFEAQFPDSDPGPDAKAGTLAHSFCENAAAYTFSRISKADYQARVEELKKDPMYNPEMLETSEFYAQYLWTKAKEMDHPASLQEFRVDLSQYVPEGFGTCDSILIGGGKLHITDYKHGKGVVVHTKGNTQMRLYALGALNTFQMFYGDSISTVSMAIVQPRITHDIEEEELPVSELLAWGKSIIPTAKTAYTGDGAEFVPGDWCRFCKGRKVCRARSQNYTALQDFQEIVPDAKTNKPFILSDKEVADILKRAESLEVWIKDLRDYATEVILAGRQLPGFRVVAGKSDRVFSDADKAIGAIRNAGYGDDVIMKKPEPKSLAQLEKVIGKKTFADIAGQYVVKPVGKPTLVDADDKRPDYSSAEADFKGVSDGKGS